MSMEVSSEPQAQTTQGSKNGYQKDYPKPAKTYELTDGNIRIGALQAALKVTEDWDNSGTEQIIEIAKGFEEYIRNGK